MPTLNVHGRAASFFLAVFAGLALTSCGGGAGGDGSGSGSAAPTLGALGTENVLLTSGQMQAMGFSYGPVDGTLGAIVTAGTYTLFGSANKTAGAVQGAFAFAGSPTSITGSNLVPLLTDGADPNGYDFDKSYTGGGPVIPLYSGTTQVGYLMSYHGEFSCRAANGCSNANAAGGAPNFYSSLGLAFSTSGAAFSKLGEVIQPYPTRQSVFAGNANLEVGGGAMMVADGNGNFIPNFASLADKSAAYLYIFFSDEDASNAQAPCSQGIHCVGVARAAYNSVVTAAVGGDHAQFPALFRKYYQGSFGEAATSLGNDQSSNSGHYTAVIADSAPLYPSVVYVTKTGWFLATYSTGNDRINFQTGADLLHWSGNIAAMQISQSGWTLLEPSLLGESSDPMTSNGSPYVYYVKANNWLAQNWRSASYVDRQITF
jgi:hypothetical protein